MFQVVDDVHRRKTVFKACCSLEASDDDSITWHVTSVVNTESGCAATAITSSLFRGYVVDADADECSRSQRVHK